MKMRHLIIWSSYIHGDQWKHPETTSQPSPKGYLRTEHSEEQREQEERSRGKRLEITANRYGYWVLIMSQNHTKHSFNSHNHFKSYPLSSDRLLT